MKKALADFIATESTGGIVLFVAAILALVFSNSFMWPSYLEVKFYPLGLHIGQWAWHKPLILWVNEGLMTIFFFLIGLEIKKEMMVGALKTRQSRMLPAFAAMGGVVMPAVVYSIITQGGHVAGWAIPTATDIAFSLGLLSLFGRQTPLSLKLFLMAIAIFDDIAAIAIIAMFYTNQLSLTALVCAAGFLSLLVLFSRLRLSKLWPYLCVGIALWVAVVHSGVHATLAGFLVAVLIPLDVTCPSKGPSLESHLHAWVAFGVLPLFAFFNCGISFDAITTAHLYHAVTLGILLGLCVGKPLGIMAAVWFAMKMRWATMPDKTKWMHVLAVACLCGVGFTMSLFIGELAFASEQAEAWIKIGVMAGSLLSGVMGALILLKTQKQE